MMTMEITQARTGRSMKKRASMAVLHKRNPKSEIRNPKPTQPAFWSFRFGLLVFSDFGFRASDFVLRISCFGFRILAGHVSQPCLHRNPPAPPFPAFYVHPLF